MKRAASGAAPTEILQRECSSVVRINYAPSPTSESDIDAIRNATKTRFAPASVMAGNGASCVSF